MTRALEEVNYRLTRKIGLFDFILDDTLLEGVVGENIEDWKRIRSLILDLRSIATTRLSAQIENILERTNMSKFVRAKSGISALERLYSILSHIENDITSGKVTSLTDILQVWNRRIYLRLSLAATMTPVAHGVWVLTAHKSK